MQTKKRTLLSLWTILFTIVAIEASADPCGMVPPIYVGQPPVLTRIGEQQTYVFFKDGVETFVIRPGFQGDVDNFGMLIPFPTPPALLRHRCEQQHRLVLRDPQLLRLDQVAELQRDQQRAVRARQLHHLRHLQNLKLLLVIVR